MLKRPVAIAVMLVPAIIVGCRQDPVLPHGSATERGDNSVSASAVPALAAANSICTPFEVHGSPGSVQVAGGPPPAPLHITISAEGHATHLGHYASTGDFVVTFTSPTTAIFDGGGTFTAANGDELYFTYAGDFFPGPVAGGDGIYEITGGTGRFAGATGSGVFLSADGKTTFDGSLCFAR